MENQRNPKSQSRVIFKNNKLNRSHRTVDRKSTGVAGGELDGGKKGQIKTFN